MIAGDPAPIDEIRQLRAVGLGLAEIAKQTGSTVAVIRRIVGKVDQEARRLQQEEVARRIDAEPLTWKEKAARWTAERDTARSPSGGC